MAGLQVRDEERGSNQRQRRRREDQRIGIGGVIQQAGGQPSDAENAPQAP
jgi:hypothetical protein